MSSVSDGSTFAYDADGEMTDDDGTTLAWTAFGKAATVTQAGGNHLAFTYGPDDARIEKDATVGNQSEQVLYFSGAERLAEGPYNQIRRTITLADLSIVDTGGAGGHVLYPVTDNLGGTIAFANADGVLNTATPYGPFGRRETAGWAGYMSQSQAISINTQDTDRGYTGQEALDTVNLVDYNARLYDPSLGRFLSVDPVIGHPNGTQSINPYSYVENNPLNKTDPTGQDSALSTCQTEACPAMSGGEGIGGIDWNASVGKNGLSIAPSDGPGNITSALNETLGAASQQIQQAVSANAASNHSVDNASSLGNQDPASAGGTTNAASPTNSTASPNAAAGVGAGTAADLTAEGIAGGDVGASLAEYLASAARFGPLGIALALVSLLSGDTPQEEQTTYLNHYTTAANHELIEESRNILPLSRGGRAYFTPNVYTSGQAAYQALQSGDIPAGYYRVPVQNIEPIAGAGGVRNLKTGELTGATEINMG